jgi:hypothetical protein
MKKIIIVAEHTENVELLISCLKTIFPECEIEIQSKKMETSHAMPLTQACKLLPLENENEL